MTRPQFVVIGLVAAIAAYVGQGMSSRPAQTAKRMSFENRLLLNRAALSGLRRIDVAVLASDSEQGGRAAATRQVLTTLETLDGRAEKVVEAIGYVRVELPTERLLEL